MVLFWGQVGARESQHTKQERLEKGSFWGHVGARKSQHSKQETLEKGSILGHVGARKSQHTKQEIAAAAVSRKISKKSHFCEKTDHGSSGGNFKNLKNGVILAK